VAACRSCNARKEDRLAEDVGMRLRHTPTRPHDSVWIVVAVERVDPQWEPYLQRPAKATLQPA
jgi:hypothetical protein